MTNLRQFIENHSIADSDQYRNNAERLLSRTFIFEHALDMEPCSTLYLLEDWFKSPNGDPEWLYMLKRQEYLQDLILGYYETQNKLYLKIIKAYIMEWIQMNYIDEQARYSSWRTIDTGIRLLNWAPAIQLLMQEKQLSDSEINDLGGIINDQVNYLEQHYISKYDLSNWGILITTGILVYDAINPNTIDQTRVDWAMTRLEQQMNLQVDLEGVHWEQSPLYFIEVFRSVLCVWTAYQSNGLIISTEITEVLERMLKILPYYVRPSGKLLQQGDTDAVNILGFQQTAQWLLGKRREDKVEQYDLLLLTMMINHPIEIAYHEDLKIPDYFEAVSSGNYFYQLKGDYWHFYNGRIGSGHGHAASNHLDLTINNQDILIDPGRYTYVDSKERRQLKAADSHNTVIIDNQFPTQIKDSWKFGQALKLGGIVSVQRNRDVIVKSHFSGQQNEQYTRYCVWLAEISVMVIFDVVEAAGEHTKQTNWILAPNLEVALKTKYVQVAGLNTTGAIYTSEPGISVQDQLYSEKYNQLAQTKKIVCEQSFEDYVVSYTVIGDNALIETVHLASIKQSGSNQSVAPQYCYGVTIRLKNQTTYTIAIQHENTIVGDKLYTVDGHLMYGTVSLAENNQVMTLL